ncbi:MAG: DinB family protein [Marmoricola sp.]
MADTERAPEPEDGDERSILLGWLAFHRSALEAKCTGLSDQQLVERAASPSALSLLGLVRHLAEMERVYGVWGNGCTSDLVWVWGEYADGGPDHDFDCDVSQVATSLRAWRDEKSSTDGVLRGLDLDDDRGANGRSVRWNLHKLIGEYARHNGHADLIRERIDGAKGE